MLLLPCPEAFAVSFSLVRALAAHPYGIAQESMALQPHEQTPRRGERRLEARSDLSAKATQTQRQ